ncbi:MAG: hypothetical protein PHV30_07655 [Candidatus Margulisbacteria bacterium]|nr:hypothetical protein [Candidatus Margulisiibacteriota bacterium]
MHLSEIKNKFYMGRRLLNVPPMGSSQTSPDKIYPGKIVPGSNSDDPGKKGGLEQILKVLADKNRNQLGVDAEQKLGKLTQRIYNELNGFLQERNRISLDNLKLTDPAHITALKMAVDDVLNKNFNANFNKTEQEQIGQLAEKLKDQKQTAGLPLLFFGIVLAGAVGIPAAVYIKNAFDGFNQAINEKINPNKKPDQPTLRN